MNSWPLFALVLRTPRVALRLGSDEELDALARASAGRVLPPEQAHFMSTDWTQLPSPVYERSFMQFHWKARADWRAESWSLQLIAFHEDAAVGGFGLMADDFAAQRRVRTGLWLLPEYRGQGIATEAHTALLHLAFAELGARDAYYDLHPDNATSRRLSHATGYEETGTFIEAHPGGQPTGLLDHRLTRERWSREQGLPVRVDGLDECREMFGLKT